MNHRQARVARRKHLPVGAKRSRRPVLENLESRLPLAGNLLVSTDGPAQQLFQEYTPAGSLVQSVAIPPGGTAENARDLVADDSGNVLFYNGTFSPYLTTRSAEGDWSHVTYAGWSTVNNISYGGIALWSDYAFVTDMATAGGGEKGIVRFDRGAGTATRFATGIDPIDLNVGLDGKLYALAGRKIYVHDAQTLAFDQQITLPMKIGSVTQDYRAVAVNEAGEIFVATWGRQVHRFNSGGALQDSVTLSTSGLGELIDIDASTDGRLAVGSRFGHVVQMTQAFTDITYFSAGTSPTFVAFAPPAISVSDASAAEGEVGSTAASFTVSLSYAVNHPVTVDYTTADGTAVAGIDYAASSGTVTFEPGETNKTVTVSVLGDAIDELDETFALNLSSAANASLSDTQGTGTILDDDAATLSINDATVTEGNSGAVDAAYTDSLSTPS